MQTSVGFWDAIFGRKVTMELPMPDGSIKRLEVTKRWLAEMEREGKLGPVESVQQVSDEKTQAAAASLPIITEPVLACQFLNELLKHVSVVWPSFVRKLSNQQLGINLIPLQADFLNDNRAKYELFLLILTGELQAIKNVLGGPQAERIRRYIFLIIGPEGAKSPSEKEFGKYAVNRVISYEKTWLKALSERENPSTAMNVLLIARLGLELDTVRLGQKPDNQFYSPIDLLLLDEAVIQTFALPW